MAVVIMNDRGARVRYLTEQGGKITAEYILKGRHVPVHENDPPLGARVLEHETLMPTYIIGREPGCRVAARVEVVVDESVHHIITARRNIYTNIL